MQGLTFQTFIWATNIFFLLLPLSLLVVEWARTRKPEEGILTGVLSGFILLEFIVHFLFNVAVESQGYMIYRIVNGILFACVCWVVLYKDIGDNRGLLRWMRASNTVIAAGAALVFWLNTRDYVTAGRIIFLWDILIVSCVGYITIREKEKDLPLMTIVIFLWIFSQAVHEYFFALFYVGLTALLLSDKVRDILRLDRSVNQLVREKEITFKLINDIGTSIRDITTHDETLSLILRSAMETSHAQAGAIYIYEESALSSRKVLKAQAIEGSFIPLHTMHHHEDLKDKDNEYVSKVIREQEIKVGEGLIGTVAEAGSAILIEDAENDARIYRLGGSAGNIRTLVAVPIKIKNDLLGVLVATNKGETDKFNQGDVSIMQVLADQAALSINNTHLYARLTEQKRMQRELEIATEIQMGLLPKSIPIVNGITIAAQMKPAREVGGDYYDCIKLDDNRMGIAIGDVAGKGVPAGMIMLIVRTILHVIVEQLASSKEIVSKLSARIYPQMDSRQFMTFLFLIWDGNKRILKYASAGHEHILHYQHANKKVERIRSGGLAIGMHPDVDQFVTEKQLNVAQGDMIMLYTDGITEARKSDGSMYGLDRLQALLQANAGKAPDEIRFLVLKEVFDFAEGEEQYDDQTLLVCKFI